MSDNQTKSESFWTRMTRQWVSIHLIRECKTRRGCPLLGILVLAVLCAVALPLINSQIIYPAYTEILVKTFEEGGRKLAFHTLPPSVKNTPLTNEILDAPHFLGDVYRLEVDFGLVAVRVFSPEGFTLYATNPEELETLNRDPEFAEHVTKGRVRSRLTETVLTTPLGPEPLDVVEVYVPFMLGEKFLGAMEIVFDVTEPKSKLDRFNTYATSGTILICACLVLIVLFLLRMEVAHSEMQRQAEVLREDVEHITRHDIKGPLLGALNGISYLENYTSVDQEQKDMLADMREAVNTGMELINRSLDLYKMEKGTYQYTPEILNILDPLRRVVDDLSGFAQSQGVTMQLTVSGSRPQQDDSLNVCAEGVLLYAVLSNLIKNAVEASEAGQQVDISVHSNGEATLAIHNPTPVPEAVRARFFDKFVTSGKSTGTGLGTYSARLMIEVMGGTIALDSTDETGTTVTVTLPIESES